MGLDRVNEADDYPEMSGPKTMDPVLMVTLGAVLLYLVLGSSEEFSDFTPLATGPITLYVVTFVFGVVTGWLAVSMGEGSVRLLILIVVPCLVYGIARVYLPVYVLDASELYNVLSFMAFQRVTLYVLALGVLGAPGMILGIMLRTWL